VERSDVQSDDRAAADAGAGGPLPAVAPVVNLPGAEHQPAQPSWDCKACDEPWPCDPARERLTLLYSRTNLAIVMVDRLLEAARDVPTMQPAEAFDRFLAWTRDRSAS
jgi:hypothetical protein